MAIENKLITGTNPGTQDFAKFTQTKKPENVPVEIYIKAFCQKDARYCWRHVRVSCRALKMVWLCYIYIYEWICILCVYTCARSCIHIYIIHYCFVYIRNKYYCHQKKWHHRRPSWFSVSSHLPTEEHFVTRRAWSIDLGRIFHENSHQIQQMGFLQCFPQTNPINSTGFRLDMLFGKKKYVCSWIGPTYTSVPNEFFKRSYISTSVTLIFIMSSLTQWP